jgi:hypothetical protein
MDHVCTPRADMSAVFEDLAPDNPFEGVDYQRQLEGKYIVDGSYNLENEKLLRLLKNVIYYILSFRHKPTPWLIINIYLPDILIRDLNIHAVFAI